MAAKKSGLPKGAVKCKRVKMPNSDKKRRMCWNKDGKLVKTSVGRKK
jgi:hypothetical protein